MQHLLPLYLVLCILPGIATLTVLSVLASRLKNIGLIYYLVAYASFTVSVLVNLVMFYLGINISEVISPGIFAVVSVGFPFSILMHTTLPLSVNAVTRPPGKRWIDMGFILIGAVELTLFFTPLLLSYSRDTQILAFGPVYPYAQTIQILFIGYSVVVVAVRRKTIQDLTARRYILTTTVIIAVFLPAITYEQLYFRGVESISAVPVTPILSPAFYGVLSVATLLFGVRYLMSSAGRDDGTAVEPHDSLDTIIRELAQKSGLSEREMTIILLISEGLGNKQIAQGLNISPKTVGNHIYNIYRKLNITSRYELLALLK